MKQLKAVCICGRLYFRRENELQQPNGSILNTPPPDGHINRPSQTP